jgi:hypothetical protein
LNAGTHYLRQDSNLMSMDYAAALAELKADANLEHSDEGESS